MTELARPQSGSASVLTGEVVSPDALAVTATEVAARQRSPETRRTYAAVYRTFCAFLGPDARANAVTPHAVRAYRDALEQAGAHPRRSPSTSRPCADWPPPSAPTPTSARCTRPASRGEPRALSHDEFARLLRMPDRRTRQGKRDLALLHLLDSAGLRRSEAAKLLISDVDERRRAR